MPCIFNVIILPMCLSDKIRDADTDCLMIERGNIKVIFDRSCRSDRLHIIDQDGNVIHYEKMGGSF